MIERPLREPTVGAPLRGPVLGKAGKLIVIFGLCALASAAAGYALNHKFSALERKIERLEKDAVASVDRLNEIAAKQEQVLDSQRRIERAIARLEPSASPTLHSEPRPALTEPDIELLRSFFRLSKTAGVRARFKLGDQAPAAELKAMPDFVADKISAQLRGTRFLLDRNGSLVITSGPDNEVVLIVSG